MLGTIHLYECPGTWISEETLLIMRAIFLFQEAHIGLWHGGIADQPNWLIEAFEIYREVQSQWHEKMKK